MKFPHNEKYNAQFDQIPNLVWFPYVGQDFEHNRQRIMVFAHNIPMPIERYESERNARTAKTTWTGALDEFTYEHESYTKTFRYFIKAATGLTADFGKNSNTAITDKVDTFVRRIAYANFIQGLVKSDNALTMADSDSIALSKAINHQIIEILGITHCICWGKPVFEYVTTSLGFNVRDDECLNKRGFAYRLNENEKGHRMHVLKTFHPSMPGFGYKDSRTQNILSDFLSKENP